MAWISITGGGSIPDKSKSLSSGATPEDHSNLFAELREFVDEWEAEAKTQDAAASAPAAGKGEPGTET